MRLHPRCFKTPPNGFALIELAVVLAIVGIMTGAVITGQYMIRQSQVQSIVADFTKLKSAFDSFVGIYGQKPGDYDDAEHVWGIDPNGCPSNDEQTPRTETCNGNNDGRIGPTYSGPSYSEPFRAMQHMANQGLISGTYSGVAGPKSTLDAVPGVNTYAGPNKSAYMLWSIPAMTGNANTSWFDSHAAAVIQLGATGTGQPTAPTLSPREAFNLDTKLDDGKPALGTLVAYKSTVNPGCTSTNDSTAVYNSASKATACALAYKLTTDYSLCQSDESCEGIRW